jgi:hypothetical protein
MRGIQARARAGEEVTAMSGHQVHRRITRHEEPRRGGHGGAYLENMMSQPSLNIQTDSTLRKRLRPAVHTNGHAKAFLEEGRKFITPGLAAQILERFNYKHQRRLDRPHIAKLAVQMIDGTFDAGTQVVFAVLPDHSYHLINGQHRLRAVIDSGCSVEFQILLKPVETEDQLHEAYYRQDTVQRTRSMAAIVASINVAEDAGISKTIAKNAMGAGVFIAQDMNSLQAANRDPRHGSPDGKLYAISHWWDQVKEYDAIISVAERPLKRAMANSSIIAVAIVTLKYSHEKAVSFWRGVAEDDGLKKGDPRRHLISALTERSFSGSPNQIAVLAAKAWNAWFADVPLYNLKYLNGEQCRPSGTPFAKKGRA